MDIEWLPELVCLSDYNGNWPAYEEALYEIYLNDFVRAENTYNGERVSAKKHPEIAGKSATFWHIISDGHTEVDKIPDMPRCERLCWIKPILEHSDDASVLKWQNNRGSEVRTLLWLKEKNYLVVLAHRSGYTLLWTAYTTDRSHTQRKLQREYDAYHQPPAA